MSMRDLLKDNRLKILKGADFKGGNVLKWILMILVAISWKFVDKTDIFTTHVNLSSFDDR